jgi:hypothetical protein
MIYKQPVQTHFFNCPKYAVNFFLLPPAHGEIFLQAINKDAHERSEAQRRGH